MTTTENSIDQMLKFSQTYFAQRGSRPAPEPPLADADTAAGSKGVMGVPLTWNTTPMANWDTWLSRGIPELASPLAG